MSLRPGLVPPPERRDGRKPSLRGDRARSLPDLQGAQRDAARQAWRQFARASGGRTLGDRGAGGRGVTWLFIVALGAGAVVWLTDDDEPPPRTEPTESVASIEPARSADDDASQDTHQRRTTVASAAARPDVEADADPWNAPEDDEPDATLANDDDDDDHAPAPANPRLVPRKPTSEQEGWSGRSNPRTAPPGTDPANAEALAKLPVGRADRPAVGGVGAMGIHVDRITLGSMYDTGRCSGDPNDFSASRHDRVSACFRVVHPRTTQRVTVLWQRDGEILRRTWMTIPAAHAYRTRAFIVLRDDDAGKWKVRVMSTDGVELASASFEAR